MNETHEEIRERLVGRTVARVVFNDPGENGLCLIVLDNGWGIESVGIHGGDSALTVASPERVAQVVSLFGERD